MSKVSPLKDAQEFIKNYPEAIGYFDGAQALLALALESVERKTRSTFEAAILRMRSLEETIAELREENAELKRRLHKKGKKVDVVSAIHPETDLDNLGEKLAKAAKKDEAKRGGR
jgi:flagellar biosynthesis chaperone FliJ